MTRDLKSKTPNILLNPILAIEMMDIDIFPFTPLLDFGKSTPDVMFYSGFFGDVGHEFSLFFLFDILYFCDLVGKVIGEGEETVGSIEGFEERRFRCEITFCEGDVIAILKEGLRGRFIRTARQGTNLVSISVYLLAIKPHN